MKRLALLLLLFAAPLHAQDAHRWTKLNTILAMSSTAAIASDCSSTFTIAHNPSFLHEVNPLMPHHPSVGRVLIQCGIVGLGGNLVVGKLLPNPWRSIFFGVITAIETVIVVQNNAVANREHLITFSVPW